jgi:hypothetical protein
MILFKILGVLFALFIILFIAIIVEESFVGGRRRRKLEKKALKAQQDLAG